ncbi:hypothetical protein FB451DRAFT_1565937 [Mycena latifolia]|nr:hypothetical protein FB451DRAFT_1565937 [Mycena latifolia]
MDTATRRFLPPLSKKMPPLVRTDALPSTTFAEGSRLRRRPAVVLRAPTIESAAIYCGACDPDTSSDIFTDDYDEYRPWALQILPEAQSPPPPRPRNSRSRSNGCGAQVHGAVSMMRRNQCWFGWKDGLASTVVALDTEYFPSAMAESLDLKNGGTSACGCIVSGLGCAVCGNALGTRQNYCSVHSPSSAGRDGYVFLTTAVSPARSSSSPHDGSASTPASSPLHDAQNDWTREFPTFETFPASAPSHVAVTSSAYSPVAPAGYIPFIPPSPVPPPLRSPTASPSTAPASSAATAPPSAQAPARPVRRRTLRRPTSVERHFGLDDASTSSGASPPAGHDAPRSPTASDAALDDGGGRGTMSMSEYLRTLTAPAAQARAAQRLRDALGPALPPPHSTSWVSRPAAARFDDMPPLIPDDDGFGAWFHPDGAAPSAPRDIDVRAVTARLEAAMERIVLDAAPTGDGDSAFGGWFPADAVPAPIAGARADAGPDDDGLRARIFAEHLLSADDAHPTPRVPAPAPAPTRAPDPRVRELTRHLDELGVRVAALDAAAADVRAHIESLRARSSPPQEAAPARVEDAPPPADADADAGEHAPASHEDDENEFPTLDPVDEEAEAEWRRAALSLLSAPRASRVAQGLPIPTDVVPPASPTSDTSTVVFAAPVSPPPVPVVTSTPHDIVASTRAAIAEERLRLAELQARLATVASAPSASSAPSAPAPASTLTALSGIMREQTELLARVGALVAALGTQETAGGRGVGVGVGGERTATDTSDESATGTGIMERIAAATAEARALGDRIRAARQPPPNGGWRARVAEIDAEDPSPAPAPSPLPASPTREAIAEEDKRPIRRRIFFER